VSDTTPRLARRDFRVLTQTRGGYGDGVMYDVQLQAMATGSLAWAQTFTHEDQAEEFRAQVDRDLDMDTVEFRRKYSVSQSA
jgi:hypothetical protein